MALVDPRATREGSVVVVEVAADTEAVAGEDEGEEEDGNFAVRVTTMRRGTLRGRGSHICMSHGEQVLSSREIRGYISTTDGLGCIAGVLCTTRYQKDCFGNWSIGFFLSTLISTCSEMLPSPSTSSSISCT